MTKLKLSDLKVGDEFYWHRPYGESAIEYKVTGVTVDKVDVYHKIGGNVVHGFFWREDRGLNLEMTADSRKNAKLRSEVKNWLK